MSFNKGPKLKVIELFFPLLGKGKMVISQHFKKSILHIFTLFCSTHLCFAILTPTLFYLPMFCSTQICSVLFRYILFCSTMLC